MQAPRKMQQIRLHIFLEHVREKSADTMKSIIALFHASLQLATGRPTGQQEIEKNTHKYTVTIFQSPSVAEKFPKCKIGAQTLTLYLVMLKVMCRAI